jgi:hypothetical protein
MITSMQGAKLDTADRLRKARYLLLETRSSMVWDHEEVKAIDAVVFTIDALFKNLIP